eukprot:CAMPEP_0177485194 /NCGR_PEP_ID=MMETSP0369-20130122/28425_1 /TAXON_ID=447022 ORGANISM="Scrippsiella hangoei-like, Strain SHHI-4" /NCGR_SAMPLE_ID=MMETSP0369 /ASSEMBLY_ACC=CAM_ASM_000364 /LENGTH=237 /DNA_ID=CAMNT_0018961345 /DNA_START=88 /DNA_END=802 /DNA_ORIENTATION=+
MSLFPVASTARSAFSSWFMDVARENSAEDQLARAELEESMLQTWLADEGARTQVENPQRRQVEPAMRSTARPTIDQQLMEWPPGEGPGPPQDQPPRTQSPIPWPNDEVAQQRAAQQALRHARNTPTGREIHDVQVYSSMEAAMLMSMLPCEKWTYCHIRDGRDGEGDKECRVCLEEYEPDMCNEDIVRLPCMHYAHVHCMESWLVRSPTCPVCRTNLREALEMSEEADDDFDDDEDS